MTEPSARVRTMDAPAASSISADSELFLCGAAQLKKSCVCVCYGPRLEEA